MTDTLDTILSWMQNAVFNCARGVRTSYLRSTALAFFGRSAALRWSSLVAPLRCAGLLWSLRCAALVFFGRSAALRDGLRRKEEFLSVLLRHG